MNKIRSKIRANERGFTLVEVMIGMMILTIAIVATTQVLIGQIRFNQQNVDNLSAYYLAQEGLEAVHNMRDTNWLHNYPWLNGKVYQLQAGDSFGVVGREIIGSPFTNSTDITPYANWQLGAVGNVEVGKVESKFIREIRLEALTTEQCSEIGEVDCSEDFVLVKSVVRWKEAQKEREIVLEEILTNWKNGAI